MKQTIFIAGDSTASIKNWDKRPEAGWAEFLPLTLDTYNIENRALNGRSTKSFIAQNHFQNILNDAKENDILIIQFSHNDEKKEDELRYTNPNTDYQDNLHIMIEKAKDKKMKIFLLSSICRANFEDNKIVSSLKVYADAMEKVALKNNVTYIDIRSITENYFNTLGEDKTRYLFLHVDKEITNNYPDGVNDFTHLNLNGAWIICDMITKELLKYL